MSPPRALMVWGVFFTFCRSGLKSHWLTLVKRQAIRQLWEIIVGTSVSQAPDIDADTARAVQAFAIRLASQYAVVGIILFGSRARHHYHPDSDADVAVLLRGHRGQFLDTVLSMADIAYDVLLETGVLIEALPVWEEEWEHPETYSNPILLRNISRDGIRL